MVNSQKDADKVIKTLIEQLRIKDQQINLLIEKIKSASENDAHFRLRCPQESCFFNSQDSLPIQVVDQEQHPAKPLTQEKLQDSWNDFAATLPRQDAPLKNRMINCHPAMLSETSFNVVAGNPMMADEIRQAQDRIINYVRKVFNNPNITMEILVDQSRNVEHILTRDEEYAKMKKENPALVELEAVFGLELR